MIPSPRLLAPALAVLALGGPAAAQDWTVDHEASSVGFRTEAFGGTVTGAFSEWSADIRLDPADLSAARIEARVITASGSTGNGEVDGNMLSGAGLAPDAYETASFLSEDIRATADGYAAHGTLTLRDQARPVILPFGLEIEGDRAVADSELAIARSDYGVGSASWGSTAAEIVLVLHIEADAAQ